MKEMTIKIIVDEKTTIYNIAEMLNAGAKTGEFNILFTGDQELVLYHDTKDVAQGKN